METENKNTFKIAGILQLTSPLHIASPEGAFYDFGKQKHYREKMPGTSPIIRTQQHRLVLDEDVERWLCYTPVIPANSIRGRLRRRAASIVQEVLIKNKEVLSLNAYETLRCGAPNAYPDNSTASLPEYKAAMEHPYFGVCGGGPRLIRSSLRIDTCYPVTEKTISANLIPANYHGFKTNSWLTQVVSFSRVDDAVNLTDPDIFKVVRDPDETIAKWHQLIKRVDGDSSSDRGYKELRTWGGYEVVMPGTAFYFQMELNNLGEAQRGLLLKSFVKFMNLQTLGGMVRHGYGRYHAPVMDLIDGDQTIPLLERDINTGRYRLQQDETIENYLLALEEALKSVNAGQIEEFATHVGDSADKARKTHLKKIAKGKQVKEKK